MSNLQAFMTPNTEETREVIISDRFKDKDGKVVPFVIKSLSQAENEEIKKRTSNPIVKNGVVIGDKLDSEKYGRELVLASVTTPNFRDSELCKFYATMDPLEVPSKMLRVGEYTKLVKAINDLSGFNDNLDVLEEEAKN